MAEAQAGENRAGLNNGAPSEQTSGEADGKRPAAGDGIDHPSPKRPRLSPIDDDGLKEVKDSHVGKASLPSDDPGLSKSTPVSELGTTSTARPQPLGAPLDNGHAAKVRAPTQDLSRSGTPGPSQQTRLDNLPVLSSLAGQLLTALAKMPPGEGLTLIRNLHLPNYQEYRTIRSLLDPVLSLYRTGPSFLIHTQLGMTTASQIEILRKANQAVWLASIFTGEVGLRDMNQSFLFVFVPEQGKLAKNQGNILLELKTQAFITAHRLRAADPRVVLADLFSSDMDQQILSRRSGGQPLAPSEQEFLKRLGARRDILDEHIRLDKLDELELRYSWAEFSKEISNYIYKTYGNGTPPVAAVATAASAVSATAAGAGPQGESWVQKQSSQTAAVPAAQPVEYPERPLHTYPRLIPNNQDDWMAQLSRAYEVATKEYAAKAESKVAAREQPVPSGQAGPTVASEELATGDSEGVVKDSQEPKNEQEANAANAANGQSGSGDGGADGRGDDGDDGGGAGATDGGQPVSANAIPDQRPPPNELQETDVDTEMTDAQPRSQETVNGTASAMDADTQVSDTQRPAPAATSTSTGAYHNRKDATLREFLSKMDEYAPIIPDAVTAHYLTLAGLPPPDPADPTGATTQSTPLPLARLLALATQKFIADIAADAYQYSRTRASNTSAGSNPLGTAAPTQAGPGGVAGAAGGKAGQQTAQLGVQRSGYGGGGQGGSGQGRTVLTMEDLGMAVQEYGINLKRGEFYR
ncbi:hypothetical protein DV738_g5517, partial [Chaetothyriales sp. CBS 135597]